MAPKTTEILLRTPDYFVAALDNGGVRIGLQGAVMCFDFPVDHADFAKVKSATEANVEDMFDEFCDRYL